MELTVLESNKKHLTISPEELARGMEISFIKDLINNYMKALVDSDLEGDEYINSEDLKKIREAIAKYRQTLAAMGLKEYAKRNDKDLDSGIERLIRNPHSREKLKQEALEAAREAGGPILVKRANEYGRVETILVDPSSGVEAVIGI